MAPRLHTQLMTGTAILLCASLGASAAPMGGTVVGGSATISSPSAGNLIINHCGYSA